MVEGLLLYIVLSCETISWSNKRQITIVILSKEVEYMATTHIMKEAICFLTLLENMKET